MIKNWFAVVVIATIFVPSAWADLVAWWPLDEVTAPPVYEVVGGYPSGVLLGAPVPHAEPGPLGGGDWAYDFKGGIIGVDTGAVGVVPATGDFTILAWIKTSNPHTAQGHVFSNNNWGGNAGRANLMVLNKKASFWADGFQVIARTLASTTNVDDDAWHQIGISRIGGTFYLLVDGVVEDSADLPNVKIDQVTNWTIGRAFSYQSGFEGLIADVKVYDVGYDKVAYPAYDPAPAHAESNVLLNAVLQWRAGQDPANLAQVNPAIRKHYLYANFNNPSDPNLVLVATLDAADLTYGDLPGESLGLAMDTTYFWSIEEGLDDGRGSVYPPGDPNNIAGARWFFKTVPSAPVIVTEPADQLLDNVGQDAEFTCMAISVSPAIYKWYRSTDNTVETSGDDVPVGINSDTLVITAAQLSDEGYYYCMVYNDSGKANAVFSSLAKLAIKREMAYWTLDQVDFDGTYYLDKTPLTVDPVAHNADPNGNAVFTSGIAGDAVTVDAGNGWANAGTWDPSGLSNQLTVSAWVKWDGTPWSSGGNGVVTKADATGRRWMLMVRGGDNFHSGTGWVRFSSYASGDVWVGPNAVAAGEWTHLTAVVDGENVGRVYINGELAGSDTSWSWGSGSAAAILLGNHFGGSPFPGAIDDVKIYNYALSEIEVALSYTTLSGKTACVQSLRPEAKYDLNGDCIVDIEDFAHYAAAWLECGVVPDCLP